jgi:hypothetical protein
MPRGYKGRADIKTVKTVKDRSEFVAWQAESQARLQVLRTGNVRAVASVAKSVAALTTFAETVGEARIRSMNILEAQLDMLSNKVNALAPLVERVSRSWRFARRARKVPIFGHIVFPVAMLIALRNVEKFRSSVHEFDGLDQRSLTEVHNIRLTIRQAAKKLPAGRGGHSSAQ